MPAPLTQNQLRVGIGVVLTVITLAVYWPAGHYPFISIDDPQYVVKNPHVNAGVTESGILWAFKNGEVANWHPLTWISHMVDCQLFGLRAGPQHLVNILFHAANTVLLFLLLNRLTGALWRSALVAALFAWHPTHVESVAWIAERKDVLSAFFFLLTLFAYARFTRSAEHPGSHRPSAICYLLALLFFTCGLMSKPMVVTLPFVLLLLDFWPLDRFRGPGSGVKVRSLLVEKIPFFALAAVVSAITFFVQKNAGATWTLSSLPIPVRIANALLAYVRYIAKTVWPSDLAFIYPYLEHWPMVLVAGAAILLLLCSASVIMRAKQRPYLLTGWFWFLGTLVPVIGFVQVGAASMADRYLYLPGIGLYIIVAWGLNDLLERAQNKRMLAGVIGSTALAGCLAVTSIQLVYWQNSIALLKHTVEITTDNYTACAYLGGALEEAGQKDAAREFYMESVRIEGHFPLSRFALGKLLLEDGRFEAARSHLAEAARMVPDDGAIRYYLGLALSDLGRSGEAIDALREAVRLKPGLAEAHRDLGVALIQQGRKDQALAQFAEAVRLKPDADMLFNYGLALLDSGHPAIAEEQFSRELVLKPDSTSAHYRLAQALVRQDKAADAVAHYREALRLTPDFPEAKRELDNIMASHPELR